MARLNGARTRVWNRLPRARDRAWQSMRVMRRFTLPDLVATAEIHEDNAKKYVRGLVRSGYLRIAVEKDNGRKGGHAVYQLIRDTGPRAPRMQTDGSAYDPNEHRIYQGGIKQ